MSSERQITYCELLGSLVHQPGGQRGLAHAAHAQHGDQSAAVADKPAFQLLKLTRTPEEGTQIGGIGPVAPLSFELRL